VLGSPLTLDYPPDSFCDYNIFKIKASYSKIETPSTGV
jgi:hypothetical protein